MDKLKAYLVSDNDATGEMVIFAPTAGKATTLAYGYQWESNFEGHYESYWEFVKNTSVRRIKEFDDSYRGHDFMQWNIPEDRVDLVRKLSWHCLDETDLECDECPAAKFCDRYEEFLEAST